MTHNEFLARIANETRVTESRFGFPVYGSTIAARWRGICLRLAICEVGAIDPTSEPEQRAWLDRVSCALRERHGDPPDDIYAEERAAQIELRRYLDRWLPYA